MYSAEDPKYVSLVRKIKPFFLTSAYIAGSLAFLTGSILFHPYFYPIGPCYLIGVIAFIVGSTLFCGGSIEELRGLFKGLKTADSINMESNYLINSDKKLVVSSTPMLESTAVSFIRTTISFMNGILFIVGSVAFLPTFMPKGPLIGNWIFRIGSSCALASGIWKLLRLFRQESKTSNIIIFRLLVISNSTGSALYVIGGFYFMLGFVAIGSYIWSAGSVAFIIGSTLLLFL